MMSTPLNIEDKKTITPSKKKEFNKEPVTSSLHVLKMPNDTPFQITTEENKGGKDALLGLIENRDKILNEKDTKIMKLRQMNEKLVKELKVLSNNLDKSLEKARSKPKPLDPYVDASIKAREKEVEEAQKKIKGLQKEISSLRSKLEAKTGYEKIIDLENKLKEADNKYNELQKELKGLEKN
eukprot:TRINITY_DN11240_c0_g1_i1.p1 TRINITY_DN11240_c0_g1~~TRINITY_DN11240_c0_g1_i1.p1  ORF type:complete len:182 (+),score=50.46 TRINITY_DN11240_c0_g1_i1:243-788(+)